jgi:serine/threonine protein kinase
MSTIILNTKLVSEVLRNSLKDEKFKVDSEYILEKMYDDNIFSIKTGDTVIPWILKRYKNKKFMDNEYTMLQKFATLNVPKVLAYHSNNQPDKNQPDKNQPDKNQPDKNQPDNNLNYLILSREPGIDLFEYTYKKGNLDELKLKNIAIKILSILKQIHKKKDIHKDIKPENILYDEVTDKITLIDFEQFKNTLIYRSPEQIVGKKLCQKTDMWSLGITFYYLLLGDVPFKNVKEILHKEIKYPEFLSEDCIDFLKYLIERDINLRYDCEKALEHSFLN